jgi:membrane protein CcdC involved in cytochrome C biogenesis
MDSQLIFYLAFLATFIILLVLKAENKPLNMRAIIFLICSMNFILAVLNAASINWSLLQDTFKMQIVFSILTSFSMMAVSFWVYNDKSAEGKNS